jgi:hypothetical protein
MKLGPKFIIFLLIMASSLVLSVHDICYGKGFLPFMGKLRPNRQKCCWVRLPEANELQREGKRTQTIKGGLH